jgi:hypothetical protein
MKQIIKKIKQISILLLVLSFVGCDNDDANNYPQIVAGFTYTINLNTGTVTFINTSESSNSYEWSFGDENSSTEINPIKTYEPGEYTVTLKATNVAGATETFEDIIVISDVGAPVITLLGDTTININIGGVFTDPGVTATDDLDGDVTANIVVAGDVVDVDTAGTYIITYNVSDAAGNAATQRTRTVIVADDTVVPVITLIGSATMNVTVGNAFTDPGATATDDVDGDITSSIVVGGDTVDVNTAGTYTITYNVNDTAGNPATQVARTVVVADPGACAADAAQSLNANDFNLTFATDPGTMANRLDAVGQFFQDGAAYEYADNPDASNAANNSCKVGKITNLGVEAWDNIQIDFADKITLTDGSNFTIKVFSPQSGYKVTFKLEDKSNGDINSGDKPSTATTTKTNEWEELTIPVSAADSGKYDKLVIFFDLESKNTNTYYFDDIKLNLGTGTGGGGGGGGGGTPGTAEGDIAENGGFEDGNLDGWAVYNNGGTIDAVTTDPSSGTYAVKLFASPETGLNPTLKQERKAAGTLAVGDQVKITFDYKGALTGESGTYSIQSFVEATNGVNQVVNISVNPTSTWQTYTQTYTVAAGDISGGITLEFVAICGGVPGCSSTLYLDDISVIINP